MYLIGFLFVFCAFVTAHVSEALGFPLVGGWLLGVSIVVTVVAAVAIVASDCIGISFIAICSVIGLLVYFS